MRRLGEISISRYQLIRDVSTPLDMTIRTSATIFTALLATAVFAQESPSPTPFSTAEESPAMSISPAESVTPPPAPEQTPSASPTRSVRISFVPPPLEGRISLGIYDLKGKLLRVLHQEADINEFKIGADSLVTQWDGKNDNGEDLPAGKYHARGYLVGSLQTEPMSNSNPPTDVTPTVRVPLAPNPLAKDGRQSIELAVRFNEKGIFLETPDGLPLFTIDERPRVTRAIIKKNGQNSMEVWVEGGGPVVQFHVSNVDKMMAFDCGEFELK